jgi:RNA polymerase sigma-70 factor (ECF subfamily)
VGKLAAGSERWCVRESEASSIEPAIEGDLSLCEEGHADASGACVERLYYDYAGRIYRYCLSRLDSPEEAEDALQATYLNAWRSLNSGVEPLSSRPWLFQIASNVCSSMLRTRLGGEPVELRDPESFDRIPTNVEPNDDLLGLSAALEELPERQRRALLLRDWRGLSYDEIAVELGSSYQAVETLLFRARRSVAAGLRSPEPAKVPVRARALAPLPFMLPLKDGLASIKSVLGSSVAPMKVSLGVAIGAAAPLVAYGILERGIESTKPAITAAAPKVQVETSLTYPVPAPAVETETTPEKKLGVAPDKEASHPPSDASPVTHGGESPGVSAAGHAHQSSPGDDPAPSPEPTTNPPAVEEPPPAVEEEPPSSKTTICHHTGSKKNPTVTITVAASAVETFLAKGDELGACAD